MGPTKRQLRVAAAMFDSNDGVLSQRQAALKTGIPYQVFRDTLKRFRRALSPDQRDNFNAALRRGKPARRQSAAA